MLGESTYHNRFVGEGLSARQPVAFELNIHSGGQSASNKYVQEIVRVLWNAAGNERGRERRGTRGRGREQWRRASKSHAQYKSPHAKDSQCHGAEANPNLIMSRRAPKRSAAAIPDLVPGKVILCRVQGAPRGSSIFEVFDGQNAFLAQLPNRFRKTLWIKPGSIVVTEKLDVEEGSKVLGEIIHVLLPEEVKEWRKRPDWSVLSLRV